MDEMEKIVKLYQQLSKTQILMGARMLKNNCISSFWTQRNIETGKNVKYLRTHVIDLKNKTCSALLPVDISQELLSAYSPSEKFRAVMKENNSKNNQDERKYILEIWSKEHLSHSVDLSALSLHGNVYTDVEFSSFSWSPDETKILYIAEKKTSTHEPFYKRKSEKVAEPNDSPVATKGEEYIFRQDWGEQLVGKIQTVIAVYDLEKDIVTILEGIPEDVCAGQVVWAPDASHVIGIALKEEPRKLGLIYCTNRNGALFQLDFEGNYRNITSGRKSVMCPKFSPDGKYLIWFERNADGPHHAAVKLMRMLSPNLKADLPDTFAVIDIVQKELNTTNNEAFYGLYNTSLPRRCWAMDNRRLILSTPQKVAIKTYVINIETADITELKFKDGSQLILDVLEDKLLVCRKNYCRADQCVLGVLPAQGKEQFIEWTDVTTVQSIELLKDIKYEYLEFKHDTDHDIISNFTAIYLGPKTAENESVPLIVWPHGGPHSAFFNTFALEPSVLISLGFAIVFINFRGSTGAGQANVDFLLGRVGDADVKDCALATRKCCQLYPWLDPNCMSLVGGSHGGFLVHHLSGQYPDMFKAVISRNPVTDVASMSIVSDIPDWCYVEAGGIYTQQGPVDNELLLRMRQASPIQHAHRIKAATYFMLGTKDLRVPCSQGLELYYRLKANNVPTKANLYDDCHSLSSVPNEMDHIINGALWLLEYASKTALKD